MSTPMRKQVEFQICGENVVINVDMRVIEIVERVYDRNVDIVAALILTDPTKIRLTDLAEVVMGWVANMNLDLSRRDIKNYVYSLPQDELNVIIGCIQAACLYMRRMITDEQFEILVRGEDLPPEPVAEEDVEEVTSKKNKRAASGRKGSTK